MIDREHELPITRQAQLALAPLVIRKKRSGCADAAEEADWHK